MSVKPSKTYLISAGEFSGDLLAAELVHSLRGVMPDLSPCGIAGETMTTAGVRSIAHISELSVMGVLEVARRVSDIRMIEQRILTWVDRTNPAFAVLVDFPGFHFRIAEQLHLRGIPVYQYVAPKVWAWGKSRVSQLRDHFAGVLGVLPFEEEFFLQNDVRYTYVGSPHFDRMSKLEVKPRDLGFPPDRKIIAFLPGSRMSELKGILPVMDRIRREIIHREPETLCVIPLAPGLRWDDVAPILGDSVATEKTEYGWQAAGFHWLNGWSLELMKMANSAVVASGTATLECALAGTPMSVVYVMNDLSFAIAKRLVDLKWVSLVNLLMNAEVVKEHIQVINPAVVAEEVLDLSRDSASRQKMTAQFTELSRRLEPGAADRAARWIAKDLRERGLNV